MHGINVFDRIINPRLTQSWGSAFRPLVTSTGDKTQTGVWRTLIVLLVRLVLECAV